MVLDLCLNELSIDQALLALEKRYGGRDRFPSSMHACYSTQHN